MSGNGSRKPCYHCGAPATTKEHVIPRNLFPRSSKAQRVTVPACEGCNNALSKDEEYFRMVLLAVWGPNHAASAVWDEKVLPSIERGYDGLRLSILKDTRPIWLPYQGGYAQGGLWKLDSARMDRVAAKIVRGLYYRILGRRLSADALMRFHWQPKEWAEEIALTCVGINIDPDVFTARYGVAKSSDGDEQSIWWLRFYRQLMYVVTIHVPAPAEGGRSLLTGA